MALHVRVSTGDCAVDIYRDGSNEGIRLDTQSNVNGTRGAVPFATEAEFLSFAISFNAALVAWKKMRGFTLE